jgi:hypothetical protein
VFIEEIAMKYVVGVALALLTAPSAWSAGIGTCTAQAFKNDYQVIVSPPGSDNISNLIVNCTKDTNNPQNFLAYIGGIPGPP